MISAAALCPAPPLLVRGRSGAARVVSELLDACQAAVRQLAVSDPDVVVVIGAGDATATWPGDARFNAAAFAPGLDGPDGDGALPASLGVGTWLLDQSGYAGDRSLLAIAPDEPAERCARIGADLADGSRQAALLVLGDGSARRTLKAPGYLDERSEGFDAGVERAIRAGDLGALLAIDQDEARELMVTGRPGWQVLAGALADNRVATEILYCDDPFGVAYLVASVRAE